MWSWWFSKTFVARRPCLGCAWRSAHSVSPLGAEPGSNVIAGQQANHYNDPWAARRRAGIAAHTRRYAAQHRATAVGRPVRCDSRRSTRGGRGRRKRSALTATATWGQAVCPRCQGDGGGQCCGLSASIAAWHSTAIDDRSWTPSEQRPERQGRVPRGYDHVRTRITGRWVTWRSQRSTCSAPHTQPISRVTMWPSSSHSTICTG
jgi:hypothetical protein